MGMRYDGEKEDGQATVELAVTFPLFLIVAVIAVNAMLFFSDCAAFDRVSHEAVRVHAASPAYGQGPDQSRMEVARSLAETFDRSNVSSHVSVEGSASGHTTFAMTLEFSPTLFGLGLRSSIFGIKLPRLEHTTRFVIDCYKPGAIL